MAEDWFPILIIVAFVVWPFAFAGLGLVLAYYVRGRLRRAVYLTRLFAIAGCIPLLWFISTFGFGLIPSVTIIASLVFVGGSAATGFLFGNFVDLFSSTRKRRRKVTIADQQESTKDYPRDDDNPYYPPQSF